MSCAGNSSAGPGHTFYFNVNGYPIFMKGSNWMPAHILPELGSDKKTGNNIYIEEHWATVDKVHTTNYFSNVVSNMQT